MLTSMLLLAALTASVPTEPVEVIRNVIYYDGPDRDDYRHRLDLYLPKTTPKFPTVVFIHGGGWAMGSKDGFLALPGHKAADHGRYFAEHGIAAVHVNYRLAPKAKHPDHVTDVARAIAWVRKNIAKHGGDPARLFVMGHSAGGHLAALVACDPKYLQAEGLTTADVRGVIAVGGVYTLSGELGPAAGMPDADQAKGAGVLFGHVFGNDPAVHRAASPVNHVKAGLPPFLIAFADRDLLTLPAQGEAFQEALCAKGVSAKKLLVTGRTHQSILKSMLNDGDPLGSAALSFIRTGRP